MDTPFHYYVTLAIRAENALGKARLANEQATEVLSRYEDLFSKAGADYIRLLIFFDVVEDYIDLTIKKLTVLDFVLDHKDFDALLSLKKAKLANEMAIEILSNYRGRWEKKCIDYGKLETFVDITRDYIESALTPMGSLDMELLCMDVDIDALFKEVEEIRDEEIFMNQNVEEFATAKYDDENGYLKFGD